MIFYFLSGMTVGIAAGLSPGPLLALVISESLRHGRYAGIKVASAPLISDVPVIFVSLIFSKMISGFNNAIIGVTLGGGIYLLYLSWDCFRMENDRKLKAETEFSLKKGIITNLLNPSPYIFWFTIGSPALIRMWELNRVFPAIYIFGFYSCLVGSKIIIAILTDHSKKVFSENKVIWIRVGMGFILLVFGVKFIYNAARLAGIL